MYGWFNWNLILPKHTRHTINPVDNTVMTRKLVWGIYWKWLSLFSCFVLHSSCLTAPWKPTHLHSTTRLRGCLIFAFLYPFCLGKGDFGVLWKWVAVLSNLILCSIVICNLWWIWQMLWQANNIPKTFASRHLPMRLMRCDVSGENRDQLDQAQATACFEFLIVSVPGTTWLQCFQSSHAKYLNSRLQPCSYHHPGWLSTR